LYLNKILKKKNSSNTASRPRLSLEPVLEGRYALQHERRLLRLDRVTGRPLGRPTAGIGDGYFAGVAGGRQRRQLRRGHLVERRPVLGLLPRYKKTVSVRAQRKRECV
jgi:hypothetical protein